MPPPRQCFVSYAHGDHAAFKRLCVHLKAVTLPLNITLWHDERITGGQYWNDRIQAEVQKSQIFVAFVTNHFLASDYICQHEMPAILTEHRERDALVVPLIYRESGWRGFFGNYIQALPSRNGQLCPIANWRPEDNGFAEAANATSTAIQSWFDVKPASPWEFRK